MAERKPITSYLYFWVLLAIFAGGLLGHFTPEFAVKLKPLGDGFIALVKMMIGPIIFCTVVLGIAGAGDMKKVGRVGGKALLYFEAVSTMALIIGLIVMNVLKPGAGFNADPKALDPKAVADYAKAGAQQSTVDFVLHLIPKTFTDAFTGSGDLLQVLLVAVLFGYAMMRMGKAGEQVHRFVESCSHIFLAMMNAIMKAAPLGAGGAMAFTIGRYGIGFFSVFMLGSLVKVFSRRFDLGTDTARVLEFRDGTGISEMARRQSLDARIAELDRRIHDWEAHGVAKADLRARRADRDKLEAERKVVRPSAPPAEGSFFRYRLEEIREKLGSAPGVARAIRRSADR